MSIKTKIPHIIYSPLMPITKRVGKLRSFFKEYPNKKTTLDPRQVEAFKEKTPAQKGYDEHIKNEMRESEDTKSRVDRLVKKSNRKIMSIEAFSFVPFHLFTNTIEVEESRVIFIFKQPYSFQSHSVDIADISNVFIESAFLFSKMQIVSRTFIQNNITVGYLNKEKADKVRRVIEGLRTFGRAKIDTSIYEIDELLQKLEELHQTR